MKGDTEGRKTPILLAWDLRDTERTEHVLRTPRDKRSRELVRAAPGLRMNFAVRWRRLWDANVGALHILAVDESSLQIALVACCTSAEEEGATMTVAGLHFNDDAVRQRCLDTVAAMAHTEGHA